MKPEIARALAEGERIKDQVATWAGPCRSCKWCAWDMLGRRWDTCHNPIEVVRAFRPAEGFGAEKPRCSEARKYGHACGPEGNLFQPNFFARIRSRISALLSGG